MQSQQSLHKCAFAHSRDLLQAAAALGDASGAILKWVRTYLGAQPQPGAAVQAGYNQGPQRMCIDHIADIEESIWAPRYGLKGIVDATVTARFQPVCPASAVKGCACTQLALVMARSTGHVVWQAQHSI